MSADVITTIITAAGLLVTLSGGYLAGLAWLSRRMDTRFDKVDARFDKVAERFDKVDERIHGLEVELNEVKIAVARLEGPTPRMIYPR